MKINERPVSRGHDVPAGNMRANPMAPPEDPQGFRDSFIQEIFAVIAKDIDLLSSCFSFGLDRGWRRRLVSRLNLKGSERVLDLCTGTGELALLLAGRVCRGGSVTGVDFSREMLREATEKVGGRYPNIVFAYANAKDLDFPDSSFDVVTVSFGMRNIPDTAAALRQACRVLRPGGMFCCLELTPPTAHLIRLLFMLYCFNVMPAIATKVLKTAEPYNYLPRSIEAFPTSDEFKRMLESCGFVDVGVFAMTFGIATIFEARKAD